MTRSLRNPAMIQNRLRLLKMPWKEKHVDIYLKLLIDSLFVGFHSVIMDEKSSSKACLNLMN